MKKTLYPYKQKTAGEFFTKSLVILLTGEDLVLLRESLGYKSIFSRTEVAAWLQANWSRVWGFSALGEAKITALKSDDPTVQEFRIDIELPEDSPFRSPETETTIKVKVPVEVE